MVIISNYSKEYIDNKIYIRSEEESVCPVCFSGLFVIGSKHRKVIDQEVVKQTYVIRRLRCKGCKSIHHELPDVIVPYKRHCAETIEQAISEETSDAVNTVSAISRHTVRRIKKWWNSMSVYFDGIVAAVTFRYGCPREAISRPREVMCAVVNTHNWVHTRSVQLSMQQ